MEQEPAQAEPAAAADSPPPGRRPRPVSNLRRRLLIAGVVIPNLLLVAVFFSPVWERVVCFLGGPCAEVVSALIVSQGPLVAFWAAFGRGRPLWRSLAVVFGVMANAWYQQHRGTDFIQDFGQDFAVLLLGTIWGFLMLARLLGLGLVRTADARCTLRPLQFSIADMLLWTTALAVVLGLLRWLALDWDWLLGLAIDWGVWGILFPVAVVALAAMFFALGRGRTLLRAVLLPLSIVAGVGMLAVPALLRGQPYGHLDLWNDAELVVFPAAWLVGSLWLLRLAGYRLAWQWRFRRRMKRDEG